MHAYTEESEALDNAEVLGFGKSVVEVGGGALLAAWAAVDCDLSFWWHFERGVVVVGMMGLMS